MTVPLYNTLQDVFNVVYPHALKQQAQAATNDGCVYRTDSGLKCFIGALIPDGLYDPKLEGVAITVLTSEAANHQYARQFFTQLGLGQINNAYLYRLQKIHDEQEPSCWKDRLTEFANVHNLTIPEEQCKPS